MANDLDLVKTELVRLLEAHNRWTARIARLQLAAASLGGAPADEPRPEVDALQQLESALAQAVRERDEALAQAAEWERKAREIGRQIAAERLSKGKQIMELRQQIADLKR